MKAIRILRKNTDSLKELLILYVGVLTISSILYSFFEAKDLFTSFWWSIVTALTVGYGDAYPTTIGGRMVGIFLMHSVTLFILPMIVAHTINKLQKNRNEFTDREQRKLLTDIKEIKERLSEKT